MDFCSNKATLGGFLDSFKKGASHQKDQVMIKTKKTPWYFQCHPYPLEREKRLTIKLIINIKCDKGFKRILKVQPRIQRASGLVNTSSCWEVAHPNFIGTEVTAFGTL